MVRLPPLPNSRKPLGEGFQAHPPPAADGNAFSLTAPLTHD